MLSVTLKCPFSPRVLLLVAVRETEMQDFALKIKQILHQSLLGREGRSLQGALQG